MDAATVIRAPRDGHGGFTYRLYWQGRTWSTLDISIHTGIDRSTAQRRLRAFLDGRITVEEILAPPHTAEEICRLATLARWGLRDGQHEEKTPVSPDIERLAFCMRWG